VEAVVLHQINITKTLLQVICLMETKLKNNSFEKIKNKVGYGGWFVVDGVRKSGGLAAF
jgi:hypothetical protein